MPPLSIFPSQRDPWLVALLLGAVALIGVSLVFAWVQGRPAALGVTVVGFLGAALVLWVLYGTDYRVHAGELHVRSGPFRWRVPLAQIRAVEPTRSPLSSPALSLNRLRIRYGNGKAVMVSPADREGFFEALRTHGASV